MVGDGVRRKPEPLNQTCLSQTSGLQYLLNGLVKKAVFVLVVCSCRVYHRRVIWFVEGAATHGDMRQVTCPNPTLHSECCHTFVFHSCRTLVYWPVGDRGRPGHVAGQYRRH